MKRLFLLISFAALVVACKEPRGWCPVEVYVPIVSADIPDTVDAGQRFTADFVLDKGECIKEYGMRCSLNHDTIRFFGAAIQDYCDKFPDTARVEQSVSLTLGDYDRYLVILAVIDDTKELVSNTYKYIVIRKK